VRCSQILLVLVFLTAPAAASGQQLVPATIREQVVTRGARDALSEISSDPKQWAYVLSQIETGNADWVGAAIVLRPASDGGAASELDDSMFVALRRAPETVLLQAIPVFSLTVVCGGRGDPLPSFEQAIDEVDTTEAAVSSVERPSLADKRRECLSALRQSREHLRRFLGRTP